MGERAPALAGGAYAARASLAAWVRAAVRDPRRLALVVLAAALLGVACAVPPSQADVIDSVPFSIGFFATLLTGEAVIFALSFSASSAWPSLREIDRHIAFREWVVTGWLGAMLTASELLAGAQGLAEVGAGADDVAPRMAGHRVVSAYLGQLDEAAARSDGNGVRDLTNQLAEARGPGSGQPYFVLHLEVVHRLAKAALVGKLDPVVASSAAEMLIGSLLGRLPNATAAEDDSDAGAQLAAAVMGQASRYLAWLGRTSLVLSARQVAGAARELVAFTVRARLQILRRADPDPRYVVGAEDLGTPLAGPVGVLAWIADFTEFHGAHQAAGMYPVYEILTGTKFLGNYWDGDSVLSGLRDALFPGGTARAGPAMDPACAAFGSAAQFDRIWTLISVGAVATLREPRLAHPPELVRPEFTPDPQLLGAYVRTFASHRYFTTADQAMSALITTVGQTGQDGDLWHWVNAVRAGSGWAAPVPLVEPCRRLRRRARSAVAGIPGEAAQPGSGRRGPAGGQDAADLVRGGITRPGQPGDRWASGAAAPRLPGRVPHEPHRSWPVAPGGRVPGRSGRHGGTDRSVRAGLAEAPAIRVAGS
jgi:hypothetical protein